MVAVSLSLGGVVHATESHPFMVAEVGTNSAHQVVAKDLRVGDRVRSGDGGDLTVVKTEAYRSSETVFNLTVDVTHTFVVSAGGRGSVVHNCGGSSEDELLDAARAARDDKAAEVGKKTATVTGGYGPDGVPRAGCSSNPVGCAEDDVARQVGGDPKKVKFTEAIRPRTGRQVPICKNCQGSYDQSQFPPGTLFEPEGPWSR